MKRVILIVALFLFSAQLFAQDKDHSIIGRLKGSKLVKFELKNYEKFYIPLGKIEKSKFSKLDSVEGKIERRLYEPKKGTTVLEVYKNYLSFLKQLNAEILYKANGSEFGGDLGDVYYRINPMMGLVYRNTLPYSFTVVEKTAKAFISAKLSKNGKDYYINLIIGNGYEPYTMYQLDIVETKKMEGAIMIVNNSGNDDFNSNDIVENKKSTNTNTTFEYGAKRGKESKPVFKLQTGYTHYKLTSPQLFGGRYSTQNGDVNGGSLEGFRDLDGFEYEISYFINKNISIDASYGTFRGENSLDIDNENSNEYHNNKGKISYIRLGLTGTLTGKDYPVKLSFSTGAGNAKFKATFDSNYSFSDGRGDYSYYYEGECHFILIYFQTQLSVPITNGIYLFTEYEYNIGFGGELTMSDSSNDEYHEINYRNPGFGGNLLKVGIGYEFSVK